MGARLVRDNVGSEPWRFEEAKQGLRDVEGKGEHLSLLQAKLLEEVGELLTATTKEEHVEEAADVLQVVLDLIALRGHGAILGADIILKAHEKRRRRGGFDIGTVWES